MFRPTRSMAGYARDISVAIAPEFLGDSCIRRQLPSCRFLVGGQTLVGVRFLSRVGCICFGKSSFMAIKDGL